MLGRLFGADGLAHDQRRDLFNHLSAGLDSTQLERVYRALGPEDRQAELLDAIVTYASDATRAELVSRLASDTTDKPYDLSIGFGTIMTQRWDRDARAISCLIGSLRQVETIEQSIASLDTPQLEAVLKAGTAHRTLAVIHVGSISRSQLFDTSGIEAVIDALGRGNDTAQKARVFELASRQIDAIRDTRRPLSRFPGAGDAAGSVAKALSDLVKSDTGAIVTALERGDGISSSRTGNGMSTWIAEMVRQDDISGIQALMGQLQAGKHLDTEPAEFLSRFTTDEFGVRDFQNASNLGFLIGAVREGINAIDADAQRQADLITSIFGTALNLGSLMMPGSTLASKAAWVMGSSLTRELIGSVTEDLASGRMSLQDALEQLALPRDVISSGVTGPFSDAIVTVERN